MIQVKQHLGGILFFVTHVVFFSSSYLFWLTVDDEQVAPLCLTPGPAGAPGELAGGDVVALVLKQPPAVRTLCANTLCRNT